MNKSKICIIFIITLISFGQVAYAQRYERGLIDKTVALVGGEMIQLSTIEAEVQMMMLQGITSDKNIRCEVLENLIIQKLLLTQARADSLSINPDQIESELNRRIQEVMTQLGGEKATEEYFKKPIFKLKADWREMLTEQFMTQEMRSKIAQSIPEITPSEVNKFYRNTPQDSLPIVPTQYKFRQIAIYPDKESAVLSVKERLLEFRERIIKGERFSTLATLYSQDPGSAVRGGELGMAAAAMYWAPFSDAAMSLKEGQVSQIVETPDGFHIIQMIKKEGEMFNARHILLKPQYTTIDRAKAFNELDSIRNLIVSDSISFVNAAMRFSQDPKSFINGGLVSDRYSGSAYFEKDQLKPIDFNILKDLKEGEISMPFETTDDEGRSGNTVYKIIKLEQIIPSHIANFQYDYSILHNEVTNREAMKAIERFIDKKKESTFIRVDSLFDNCPFIREGWLK